MRNDCKYLFQIFDRSSIITYPIRNLVRKFHFIGSYHEFLRALHLLQSIRMIAIKMDKKHRTKKLDLCFLVKFSLGTQFSCPSCIHKEFFLGMFDQIG